MQDISLRKLGGINRQKKKEKMEIQKVLKEQTVRAKWSEIYMV